MDAEQIANVLEKSWKAYSYWKSSSDKKQLHSDVSRLRGELEAIKLHATVKQAAEIELFEKLLDGRFTDDATEAIITQRKRAASAESQRFRALLLADMYNPEVRRMYLASRTSFEVSQDREAGWNAALARSLFLIVLVGLVGAAVGYFLSADRQPTYFLGIHTGSEVKSFSWFAVLLLGVIGAVIGVKLKPLICRRSETLWAELGPIPDKLAPHPAEKIRRKLFPRL
jgi:uncharacterized membrane protein YeaQ/YmgE (transglycosylase-associated protein family)